MIIANIEEMLANKLDTVYGYQGHQWLNQKKNCGCVIAICLDIEPDENDRKFVTTSLLKRSNLQVMLKESSCLLDDTQQHKLEEFKNELLETQEALLDFLRRKRGQYKFSTEVDCSYEYFFIKLKQDPSCHG